MSRRSAADEYVSLSAADMSRFLRNAPAALARRGGGYVAEALSGSFEMFVLGGVPIAGMLWYGWSGAQLLAFLVVGAWVGMVCDFARLVYAGRGVQAFAQTHYDDWHVWVVVEALRAGRTTAPRSHVQAKHEPWAGVFVDLAAGGMGTAVICAMSASTGMLGEPSWLWSDRSFLISMACFAGYQAASAAWEIARHRRAGAAAGPVEAHPGARGVGLFMLMFVMLMVGDPETRGGVDARRMMLVVNGAIVLIGLLNAASILWLKRETVWLRDYLRDLTPEAKAAALAAVAPTKKSRRKKRRR